MNINSVLEYLTGLGSLSVIRKKNIEIFLNITNIENTNASRYIAFNSILFTFCGGLKFPI
jgi:hypothetical protein